MNEQPKRNIQQYSPTPEQYLAATQPNLTDTDINNDRPPKKRWVKKIVVILILLVVGFGLNIFINLLRVSANPFDFSKLKGEREGRINVLLLGVGDADHEGPGLSDTVMVASIDPKNNQMAMISLPRDLRVHIPGYGEHKINEAHSDGGPELARQTVEQTLGITIHYYVRANFTGLKQAVDAVGGIDVNVQESLSDPEYPCDKNQYRSCGLLIKKGQQHMNGDTALKYARCRKGNCGDDFGRALRQQEVLQAVRQRAVSLGNLLNPLKVGQMASALGDNIKSDLSVNQILRLAKMVQLIWHDRTYNVVLNIEPGGYLVNSSSSSDLLPSDGTFDEIRLFVKDVFRLAPIWAENPALIIQNGTKTVGIGAKLRDKIAQDGYRIDIEALSNAARTDHATSEIIDYSNGANLNTQRYLEDLIGVKATSPQSPVKNPPADFRVILGDDYVIRQNSSQDKPK